jgi:lysozyme
MLQGLDVNHANAVTSWSAVAAAKQFVILKATQSTDFVDNEYGDRRPLAKDAGLTVGAYLFFDYTQAGDSQAELYISTVGDLDGELPPAVDVELVPIPHTNPVKYKPVPAFDVAVSRLEGCLDALEARYGVPPLIYTSRGMWDAVTNNPSGFGRYPLWVASTLDPPTMPVGWSGWVFHQHGVGACPGCEKPVDLDRFNGDAAALAALTMGGDMPLNEQDLKAIGALIDAKLKAALDARFGHVEQFGDDRYIAAQQAMMGIVDRQGIAGAGHPEVPDEDPTLDRFRLAGRRFADKAEKSDGEHRGRGGRIGTDRSG